jgi:hypothetical protein
MNECRKIITDFLIVHGYDGLFNVNVACGCLIDDLAPCEGDVMDCEAGYRVPCDGKDCECDYRPNEKDRWHIAREKEVPK